MKKIFILSAAALMLAACQSGSAPKNAHLKSAGTPAGESCKVIRGDTAGGGKNIIYRCSNGQAAINAAIADGALESGIPVSFGGGGCIYCRLTVAATVNDVFAASCGVAPDDFA